MAAVNALSSGRKRRADKIASWGRNGSKDMLRIR